MGLKILAVLTRWVFILSLPALFISASLAWGFNSSWLYEHGFQKYDVSQVTGISSADLQKSAVGLIHYFNSGDEYAQVTVVQYGRQTQLLTEDEQLHFKDVKALVWLDYKVFLVTLILVLAYSLTSIFRKRGVYRRQLARYTLWGCGLSILLIIVAGIASLFDFNSLFLQFHYLVFTNQYWSAPGNMLLLFPDGFWYDAVFFCMAFMAGIAIILGGSAVAYLRLTGKKKSTGELIYP